MSLVLLTASVALGIVELVRFASPRWPRFVVAALHRNVSLLAMAFLCVHVGTAVADSFAPIHLIDVVIPFVGSYRPIWLGLGTVAFDLLLAVIVTSLLRERLGYRLWRTVHWAAYAAWPVALVHGLGTGSDTKLRWALIVNVACMAVVLTAVFVRVGWTRTISGGQRAIAVLASSALAFGVTVWMLLEPMRAGWARKAGTPSTLLASAQRTSAPLAAGSAGASSAAGSARFPVPFTSGMRGSLLRRTSAATGLATVTIDAVLPEIADAKLRVVLVGTPLTGGGVQLQRGTARLGPPHSPNLYRGQVTVLDGTDVRASVQTAAGSAVGLNMDFLIDDSNRVTGTVSGRAESGVR